MQFLCYDPGSMQARALTTGAMLPSLALSPGNGNRAWFWKEDMSLGNSFWRADGSSKHSGNRMSKRVERYPRMQSVVLELPVWVLDLHLPTRNSSSTVNEFGRRQVQLWCLTRKDAASPKENDILSPSIEDSTLWSFSVWLCHLP